MQGQYGGYEEVTTLPSVNKEAKLHLMHMPPAQSTAKVYVGLTENQ